MPYTTTSNTQQLGIFALQPRTGKKVLSIKLLKLGCLRKDNCEPGLHLTSQELTFECCLTNLFTCLKKSGLSL